jgi:uncharacterized protein YegL
MPKLMGRDDMQTGKTIHNFEFSGANLDKLGASQYTLVTICQDTSGSVGRFKKEMEDCLKKIREACEKSPRSENLLSRLVGFNSYVTELHGFMELKDIPDDTYEDILKCIGATALRDAAVNAAEATEAYGQQLYDMDYQCNGIMFVITDGDDNSSVVIRNNSDIKKTFNQIKINEKPLESFLTILIGVGNKNEDDFNDIKKYLKELSTEGGFDQFIMLEDASPNTLAKLADFISRSISSSSTSLANGQPSQPITDLTF